MDIASIIAWFNANGIALAGLVAALILVTSTLQKIVDSFPNHQEADTLFGKVLRVLETIAGILPALPRQMKKLSVRKPIAPVAAAMLFLALAPTLGACATTSWNTPVFYAGPAVAPIEEVSLKTSQAAAAGGFQASVGFGQFPFQGKEWDALDLSVLALGGVALPGGAGPVGTLQLGGEIGTMNGIIGVGLLATPYTANGQGFLQGGGPGFAVAGMLNVTAIAAYLSTGSAAAEGKDKLTPRLPRGGL
jgi:hypothetical protein